MALQYFETMVFEFDIELLIQFTSKVIVLIYLISFVLLFGVFSDLKVKPFDSFDEFDKFDEYANSF